MSKHVDLIAVGVLLCVFAFAARVHELVSLEITRTHVLRVLPQRPMVTAPPHAPHTPRVPRFPNFPHVQL
jgi:hypothetical protein